MSTLKKFDIAVIGDGIVGKTAALALAQSGFSILLIGQARYGERSSVECGIAQTTSSECKWQSVSQDIWDQRIYSLSNSAQHLFESLGVWQQLDQKRICAVDKIQVYGDRGGALTFSAYQARLLQLSWIVESTHLSLLLDKVVADQRLITRVSGQITHLEINAEYAVLWLEQTADPYYAALCIGADGAQSWLRAHLKIGQKYTAYPQAAIVANFHIEKPHQSSAYQWFAQGEIIALLPLPNRYVSLVWSAHTQHAEHLCALNPEAFTQELMHAIGSSLGQMQLASVPQHFALRRMNARQLAGHRWVLLGDAAHVMHPLAGQGLNLGLRDVSVLNKVLNQKEYFRNCGEERILKRYQRARAEDIASMSLAMHGLYHLFAYSDGVLGSFMQKARNIGLDLVNHFPGLKRFFIYYQQSEK